MIVFALALAALILAVVALVQGRLQPVVGWAILVLAIAVLILTSCGPVPARETAPMGPGLPTAPPPGMPANPGTPAGDAVLVAGDSLAPDSLSVPRLVLVAPGAEASAAVRLVAGGAPRGFEVIVAQDDTTAAVLRARSVYFTRNRLLAPADLFGQVLASAQVVVVSTFDFQSPGSFTFGLPIEGRSPGRSLLHVFWQRAGGEELGKATVEVRVE